MRDWIVSEILTNHFCASWEARGRLSEILGKTLRFVFHVQIKQTGSFPSVSLKKFRFSTLRNYENLDIFASIIGQTEKIVSLHWHFVQSAQMSHCVFCVSHWSYTLFISWRNIKDSYSIWPESRTKELKKHHEKKDWSAPVMCSLTLTTSSSVDLHCTASETSVIVASAATVTTFTGTATVLPFNTAVFRISVSCRRRQGERVIRPHSLRHTHSL